MTNTQSQSHNLTLPLQQDCLDRLRIGDLVYLTGDIVVTVGLPTHKRMKDYLQAGVELPIDLKDGMWCQVGAYIEQSGSDKTCRYINPSTSTRFEPHLPAIIRASGVKAIGGKGGVGPQTVEAMREMRCVYLSFVGGASALTSEAVEDVIDVAWTDLILQFRLTRLRVKQLGPLTVGVDVRGNSLYSELQAQADSRFEALMKELNETRAR
ncbi:MULTISPECIES: fumarate hydratase C-terminal domain-containing protein [unclassified Phaeobacter]|uniref:fumarate hydratase C-terminal domain-containing protein n=1 Tax=unclassified Phaeobacter TaxID=2621772 RepID=UPI003A89CD1E